MTGPSGRAATNFRPKVPGAYGLFWRAAGSERPAAALNGFARKCLRVAVALPWLQPPRRTRAT